MEKFRELSGPCFEMLDTFPGLRELFDAVRADEELRWEVRLDNTLTCYYKSGKLFGMKFLPPQKLNFDFNSKYFDLDGSHRTAFAELETWHAGKPADPRQWLARIGQLKAVMDEWKAEKKRNREAESQQALTRCNTFATGSYQYIDTEFAVPGFRQEFGQMDMVAVRREGERYIPVLVELKYDSKAFDDDSGILDHYHKITRFLSMPGGEARLVETIRRIWKTKLRLGLLEEPVPEAKAFGETELMFAVTGWKNGRAEEIRARLPEPLERTVRVAISPDLELVFGGGDRETLFPKSDEEN